MINYVCRDKIGQVQYSNRKTVSDNLILIAKALAFWEGILVIIQKCILNVVLDSDSQIVIQAVKIDIKVPNQISQGINLLAKAMKSITFYIVINPPINSLIGLQKKAHHCNI